jgi:2',3'-cyclic-nucleotide 2'-phosphodiesterase (5'-nucleotidase family)
MLLLDNGDFLKTYPMPAANVMAGEMMSLLHYDAIGVGDQEFVEGISFLEQLLGRFPLSLLNANILFDQPAQLAFQKYRIVERAGYRVGITALLSPQAFEFIHRPRLEILDVEETLAQLVTELSSQCDIIIAVYHADFREAMQIARKFPQIPIILAGHSQEQAVRRLPGQIILQPGYDGEYVGFLEISKDDKSFTINHSFLAVKETMTPAPILLQKLQQYHDVLEQEE